MGNGDHLVVDYLKRMRAQNPTFFYSIESSTDNYKNMFWVDPCFRMNYNYFGDTVRLDIAPHHYTLPLVSITGINHHGQPILFGCGLLHHHSFASYIWLLQNWLHAMSGNYPVSITTQPDHHIQMAVAQLLPQTRHRFCKSTIFRQTREKLSQTQSFHNEFRNCIHETETVHEFESCWEALLRRYSLMDNEWLHSIYNARHQWVPAYMKQTFFGQLLLPEEEEEENDMLFFFNGYVNSTTSIQSLVKQYESAVTSWQEMEVKADFETATTMPVLKTPSPMEKQAASLYTRRAFIKFQDELVETLANQATKLEEEEEDSLTTYRVAKFGDEEQQEKKKAVHIVRLNTFEMKAICSCHMFEFSGIICQHALSVFRAQNVLTLPSQYILKRWTRDAKRGATGGDEYVTEQLLLTSSSSNFQDSLTLRYNNLRHEAIKFVEEGAKSIHIYNTAVDALQVAANKVAASKKRVNDHQGVLLNGENQETNLDKGSQQTPYQSKVEKEKKINELSSELENISQRCEVYRANLLAVLRDMEEHKLKLSVKVQNARLSLKE